MSDRRHFPTLRRLIDLTAWLVSMFEEKSADGHRRLSMKRCSVAAFTVAFVGRLADHSLVLGWPDAVLGFAILFALVIAVAFSKATPDKVVEAVAGMFQKGDSGGGSFFSRTAWRDELDPRVAATPPSDD